MRLERGLRVRMAAGGILVLVFGAGTALGFALDRDGSSPPGDAAGAAVQSEPAGPPQHMAPPNGWIIDRLDLTADERSRVDSVIEHFGTLMGDLQKEYRPRYRAVVDSTNRALRDLLTDEQRARYDSMKAAADGHPTRGRGHDLHR